jgi:hypothetical protein
VPILVAGRGGSQVRYYCAYNLVNAVEANLQYAISPDRLDEFARNISSYYDQATTVQTPPPVKAGSSRLSGPRFPKAPDAWNRGIVQFAVASNTLPTRGVYTPPHDYFIHLDFQLLGRNQSFLIVPHVMGLPNPQVMYYIVYDLRTKTNLFAVGPDDLDCFAEHAERYLFVALASSPDTEYAVEASRMQDHLMRMEWGDAFRAWGRSWKAAATDPAWWVFSFGIPTLGALMSAGGSQGARAMKRLQETQINQLDQEITRTARILKQPETFRHSLTRSPKAPSYARIEQGGVIDLSEGEAAHYGEGVYTWAQDAQGVGKYIDIEVPAGVAVETIQVPAKGQTFYRLVPATGDTLPIRIVGTNLSQEEIAFGRRMIMNDLADDPVAPPPPPSGPTRR